MEKRKYVMRTLEEKKQIIDRIDELKGLGFTMDKACDYLGIEKKNYYRWQKELEEKPTEPNPVYGSAQLEGIAYGLESIALKLDKLIDIGNALLAEWTAQPIVIPKEAGKLVPATPVNNFGRAEIDKVERELGITKFKDVHHI